MKIKMNLLFNIKYYIIIMILFIRKKKYFFNVLN